MTFLHFLNREFLPDRGLDAEKIKIKPWLQAVNQGLGLFLPVKNFADIGHRLNRCLFFLF